MIIISKEFIVKYNGDILGIRNKLDIEIEIELLSPNYAIVSINNEQDLENLIRCEEIEQIEEPLILKPQDVEGFINTGISNFKNRSNLTGKGTIIGIVDSGIDYNLPVFKDDTNNSKIIYYWDQTDSNFNDGQFYGRIYNNQEINAAISGIKEIPVSTLSNHGNIVAGTCSFIANKANLIVVKVGRSDKDNLATSIDVIRAMKFIMAKALELNMPLTINLSYGTSYTDHRGDTLFEKYIDELCMLWKTNIVVCAGNDRNSGRHKNIKIYNDKKIIKFQIDEGEQLIDIDISNYVKGYCKVYLISPLKTRTNSLSARNRSIKNKIGSSKVRGFYGKNIKIQLIGSDVVVPGIWKLVIEPIEYAEGDLDIYMNSINSCNNNTRFLNPCENLTVMAPATCENVITVGSYNPKNDEESLFSSIGDRSVGVEKPDILAPGESIYCEFLEDNNSVFSGTSISSAYVSGVCSLMQQWGVVNDNDRYLYGEKLKQILIDSCRKSKGNRHLEYGHLNLYNLKY